MRTSERVSKKERCARGGSPSTCLRVSLSGRIGDASRSKDLCCFDGRLTMRDASPHRAQVWTELLPMVAKRPNSHKRTHTCSAQYWTTAAQASVRLRFHEKRRS